MRAYVGTAGWAIPRTHARYFPVSGTTLQRYAAVFPCVEINSTFHRQHRPTTYMRWADHTPADFRFSLKLSKAITHERKLLNVEGLLDEFMAMAQLLGEKLGAVLVQLPPSLSFDPDLAASFFQGVRNRHTGAIVCEPRHPSWFTDDVNELLKGSRVGRVAADPAVVPAAAEPGGWTDLVYYRLHGSPRKYFSGYQEESIGRLAHAVEKVAGEVWCIFDNTAGGAAAGDALNLLRALQPSRKRSDARPA